MMMMMMMRMMMVKHGVGDVLEELKAAEAEDNTSWKGLEVRG
jgi:hypothetical protein